MPIALTILALDAIFVVHAANTGRLFPWAYIILAIPVVGALAYVIVELLPEWMDSMEVQQARRQVANTLDLEERYNRLSD